MNDSLSVFILMLHLAADTSRYTITVLLLAELWDLLEQQGSSRGGGNSLGPRATHVSLSGETIIPEL